MDEIPCSHLLAEQGPKCYLGWNTALDCIGCCAYDWHPEPGPAHWTVWAEIRSGGATRSAADNNVGGQERLA